MTGLYAYALFDHDTGELLALNAGLVVAGVAALQHADTVNMPDGASMTVEALDGVLADQATVVLNPVSPACPNVLIERWFLGP